ncbi:MAG TPA: hypothetical protein VEK08_13300 [Planctomycetota bacterium]|nr:hypothetical protein [Planctomycetota bacterium]
MFKASHRVIMALLSGTLSLLCQVSAAEFTAAGADPVSITGKVDEFRTALGGVNNGTGPGTTSGRREINWDAVPDDRASPSIFPDDFFKTTRGLVMSAVAVPGITGGIGFEVSADAVNPTATLPRFGNINPAYTETFAPFTPERLLTIVNSTQMDVTFFVPGGTAQAVVSGFGVVFNDVDESTSTTVEFFDNANLSLGIVRALPGTFSFAGFISAADRPIFRVRITAGDTILSNLNTDGAGNDLVVMDDFLYGEPVAVAAPLIISPLSITVQVNQPINYTLIASGTPPFIYTASLTGPDAGSEPTNGSLPPGLSFGPTTETTTATITGSPTDIGSHVIFVSAKNAFGLDQRTIVLSITAVPPGPGSKTNTDSDGDGFPDEIENAENVTTKIVSTKPNRNFELFSDPNSSESTPFNNVRTKPEENSQIRPAVSGGIITSVTARVQMLFGRAQRDQIFVTGTLPVAIDTSLFSPTSDGEPNRLFVLDVGGVVQSFPIPRPRNKNAQGEPVEAPNQVRRKDRRLKITGNTFEAAFVRGNFAPFLIDEGMTNTNVTDRQVILPVVVLHKQQLFRTDVTLTYNATARGRDAKGIAK